jgi:hypothetical protein
MFQLVKAIIMHPFLKEFSILVVIDDPSFVVFMWL